MALAAGFLKFTLEFAQGLKDKVSFYLPKNWSAAI